MFKIWAVAKNTIAQAVRIKIVSVVILLLLVLLPLMSSILIGDNTLQGKLQTFISYGMSLTSLLLCVVTIVISCYSLTSDLKGKEIYLVVTKPVRRFQVICGKLLGVIVIDVFLLAIFAGLIYGLTMMMPKMAKASAEEMAQVDREFFTAREGITDPVDEDQLREMVITAYRKLEADNELPVSMSRGRILSQLREQAMVSLQYVAVNTSKVWEFKDLRPLGEDETLFIRYKLEVLNDPLDMKIYSQWRVGDIRQLKYGPDEWQSPLYPMARTDIVDIFTEFEVSADAIAEDGYLAVAFNNPGINNVTVIPREVEVLYRAGSFGANYLRAVIVILARLIFLAALGVSLSTWLSFPVAVMICTIVFCVGTVNGFITESLDSLGESAQLIYYFTVKPILWLFPRFDGEYNPTHFMVTGKLLSVPFLMRVVGMLVFAKAVVLTLFGMMIFNFREVAKPTA